jgi:hypothetical protein
MTNDCTALTVFDKRVINSQFKESAIDLMQKEFYGIPAMPKFTYLKKLD